VCVCVCVVIYARDSLLARSLWCIVGRVAVEVAGGEVISIKPERLTVVVGDAAGAAPASPAGSSHGHSQGPASDDPRAARAELMAHCAEVMKNPNSTRAERDIASMMLATEKLKDPALPQSAWDPTWDSERGGRVHKLWTTVVVQYESSVKAGQTLRSDRGAARAAVEAAASAILLEQSAIPHMVPRPVAPGAQPVMDVNVIYPALVSAAKASVADPTEPSHADGHVVLSYFALLEKDLTAALRHAEAAAKLRPNSSRVQRNKSTVHANCR
jgi:hypothetical protein